MLVVSAEEELRSRYNQMDVLIRKQLWLRASRNWSSGYANKALTIRDCFVQVCLLAQRPDGQTGAPDMQHSRQVCVCSCLNRYTTWLYCVCICSNTQLQPQLYTAAVCGMWLQSSCCLCSAQTMRVMHEWKVACDSDCSSDLTNATYC